MTTYAICAPPRPANSHEFRLLADGVSLFALVLPVVWLIWNRLWVELLAYLVVISALALSAAYLAPWAALLLSSLPGFFLFLEGRNMIFRRYERGGWRFVGVVEAENLEDAELKVLHAEVLDQYAAPRRLADPVLKAAPTGTVAAGLFPE